jgi:hypothetical protein
MLVHLRLAAQQVKRVGQSLLAESLSKVGGRTGHRQSDPASAIHHQSAET